MSEEQADTATEAEGPVLDLADEGQAKEFVKTVKRGFSLEERLKNRGLRTAKITLFTDEEVGARYDELSAKLDALDTARDRIAEIDLVLADAEQFPLRMDSEERAVLVVERQKRADLLAEVTDADRAKIEEDRAKIAEELKQSALVVSLRSVPPIIANDVRRRSRLAHDIKTEDVPQDKMSVFMPTYNARLLAVMVKSVVDNATGEVNEGIDFEEAKLLADYLPPSQYLRLSRVVAEIQYRDGVSREIEGQEDFS